MYSSIMILKPFTHKTWKHTLKSTVTKAFSFISVFVYLMMSLSTESSAQTTDWTLETTTSSMSKWEFIGNAKKQNDYFILTGSHQDTSGAIFYKEVIDFTLCTQWKVKFDFCIHNTSPRDTPGDGIAFSFLKAAPPYSLGVMGIPKNIQGGTIIIDPRDDVTTDTRAKPELYVLQLNPAVNYDHTIEQQTLFNTLIPSEILSKWSQRNFNTAIYTYNNGILSLEINNIPYGPVTIAPPVGRGYFGFSASTSQYKSEQLIKNVTISISKPADTITLETVDTVLCSEQKLTMEGIAGATRYTWIYTDLMARVDTLPINSISHTTANPGSYYLLSYSPCGNYEQTFNIAPPLSIDSIITLDVNCINPNSGEITAYASGGKGVKKYTLVGQTSSQTDPHFNGLTEGTYTVRVKDESTCFLESTVVITKAPELVIDSTIIINNACYNDNSGSIRVFASGGTGSYTYWIDGVASTQNHITNLRAGLHTLVVKDGVGCATTSQSFTLTQPDSLTFSVNAIEHVSCFDGNDGRIHIQASGGTSPYTYFVDNMPHSNNVISDLAAKTYTLYVKDANGCTSATSSSIVRKPTPIIITQVSVDSALCHEASNGAVHITATGGTPPYRYVINGTNHTTSSITDLSAGSHIISILDSKGCISADTSIIVPEPTKLLISKIVTTNVSCYGASNGSISLTAQGGTPPYKYLVAQDTLDQGLIQNLTAASYSVTLLDSKGCKTGIQTVTISQPDQLTIAQVQISPPSCFSETDGTFTVRVTGGTIPYTYIINGIPSTDSTITRLSAGSYTLQVEDVAGCITPMQTVNILQAQPLTITSLSTDSTSCFDLNDGKITVQAEGGVIPYTYFVNGNAYQNNQINGVAAGTHNVYVQDANGCTSAQQRLTIFQPTRLEITSLDIQKVSCLGSKDGSFKVNATGGTPPYRYQIVGQANTQSNPNFTNLAVGNYEVQVFDQLGCSSNIENATIESIYQGVPTYEYQIFSNCEDYLSSIVFYTSAPEDHQIVFQGDTILASDSLQGLSAGTYDMEIIYKDACRDYFEVNVQEVFNPNEVSVHAPSPICQNEEVIFSLAGLLRNNNYSIYFNINGTPFMQTSYADVSGMGSIVIPPQDSSFYLSIDSIYSHDLNPCYSKAINLRNYYQTEDCRLIIYDVFTPNGDGVNDYFTIKNLHKYPKNRVQIFDRWGVLVYDVKNYQNNWTGIPNKIFGNTTEQLPWGVYFCVLTLGEETKPIQKTIYLLKE